jgi:hypothetical protein
MSVYCELRFRPVVHLAMEKKHLEEINIYYYFCGSTVLIRTRASSHMRFLELFRHMVGLIGRVISPSQGLYLHRTTQHWKTRDKHPCLERDSNPRLRPHGHCDRQNKYLFVQLIEQEPCVYDKCSPDYSRRNKTDLGWCRIAQEMKEKGERKGG